jgi:hypothetical protein
MAHWLLRGRMAEHNEDGRARQERIKEEQHRPEQNKGYDEAARGGPGMPKSDVGTGQPRRRENPFDREAREAANDIRRRESSSK